MNIMSYYQLDYQGVDQLTGDMASLVPKSQKLVSKTIIPEPFKDDVRSLCEYSELSELTSGMTITMSLKEALQVLPRKRARVDSYQALIRFLREEMNVNLIILSKKKQNEHCNYNSSKIKP